MFFEGCLGGNLSYALYEHVFHVYFDITPNLLSEHFVYEPLVCCPYVLQSEWHNFTTGENLAYDK